MKKILFNENSITNFLEFSSCFEGENFVFEKVANNGSDIEYKILEFRPDIIVCDAFLPEKDGIGLMKYARLKNIDAKFILVLNSTNEFLEKELVKNGASYYFIKPYDINTMAMIIKDLTFSSPTPYRTNGRAKAQLEEDVTNALHEIGIPANIKGYQFLRYAILLCINEPQNIMSITKRLYPDIANKFNSTPSRVERAMRHSIEIAFTRGDINVIDSYFKNTIEMNRGKPSNSEFIAMMAETIKIKRSKNLYKNKISI